MGKYAYAISSPSEEAVTPIILDVALDVRTKVWSPPSLIVPRNKVITV